MIIKRIHIGSFGKICDREYVFDDGLNVIHGANETGKSTLFAFIGAMLFGIDIKRGSASKDDRYMKYLPWKTPGTFEGSLDFEHEGKDYRIYRVFLKNARKCICTELSTGREIDLPDGKITGLVEGLNESSYVNTVLVSQKGSITDRMLPECVGNYISNLAQTKTGEIDIHRSLEILKKKAKAIKASDNTETVEKLKEETAEIAETLAKVREKKAELKKQRDEAGQTAENMTDEADALQDRYEKAIQEINRTVYKDEEHNGSGPAEVISEADEKLTALGEEHNSRINSIREKLRQRINEAEQSAHAALTELQAKQEQTGLRLADEEHETGNECDRLTEEQNSLTRSTEEANEKLSDIERELRAQTEKTEALITEKKKFRKNIPLCAGIIICGTAVAYLLSEKSKVGILIGILLMLTGLVFLMVNVVKDKSSDMRLKGENDRTEKLRESENEVRGKIFSLNAESGNLMSRIRANAEKLAEIREKRNGTERDAEQKRHIISENLDRQKNRAELEAGSESENENLEYEKQKTDIIREKDNRLADIKEAGNRRKSSFEMMLAEKRHAAELLAFQRTEKLSGADMYMKKSIEYGDMLADYEEEEENLLNTEEEKNRDIIRLTEINEQADRELKAVELAMETVSGLSELIYRSFGEKLNGVLSEIAFRLTGGRYDRVVVDSDMSIRFLDESGYRSGSTLSTGAEQQLYLALRMALGSVFFENTDVPVMLDEPFAYYDEKRMKAALDELLGEQRQVLLFTCREAEISILNSEGSRYKLTEMDSMAP